MKNISVKFVIMSCALVLFAGCGVPSSGVTPDAAEPSGTAEASDAAGQPGTAEASDAAGQPEAGGNSSVTVAQVKAAVLENAGLSEEEVRFVRIHLDSENGASEYDVEFICQDGEYDYKVSAVTGEILSMNCEMGNYNLDTVPSEVVQSANTQPETVPGGSTSPETVPGGGTSPETVPGGGTSPETVPGGGTSPEVVQSAGTRQEAGGQYIGVDAAKQAALGHAGLRAEDVRFVHAHLELDDGIWKYDVEFHKGNTEYDYDIDALTGTVLSFDQDAEYYQHGASASAGNEQITEDRAKQIALEYAGVAEGDAQYLQVKFDYDDGRAEYEVEWYVGWVEYSCDVDAVTGAILSFDKELD